MHSDDSVKHLKEIKVKKNKKSGIKLKIINIERSINNNTHNFFCHIVVVITITNDRNSKQKKKETQINFCMECILTEWNS